MSDLALSTDLKHSHRVITVRSLLLRKMKKHEFNKGHKLGHRDMLKICFLSRHFTNGVRNFELSLGSPPEIVGFGAADISCAYSDDDVQEYCLTVIKSGMTIEAWTSTRNKKETRIAVNGSEYLTIESKWNSKLLLKWPTEYSIFSCPSKSLIGTVKTGHYLFFDRYLYSESLVTWNSLKATLTDGRVVPIHLARHDKISDFLGGVSRLASFGFTPRYKNRDYVIPEKSDLRSQDEALLAFVLNIIFRNMFYDLAYADKTSG